MENTTTHLPRAVQQAIDEYVGSPRMWARVCNDFYWMARGEEVDGARAHYPGWTDEDFKSVIRGIEGDIVSTR